MAERFCIIREAEYEALKTLSANACKALVALKFGQCDGAKISFGVRDLEAFGMKKSAAADALKELAQANLIAIEKDSSFGAKRSKRVWRVIHTRDQPELQSATADTGKPDSPPRRTMARATVRHGGHGRRLQSAVADTPKETSPTSSSKSEEGEVSPAELEERTAFRTRKRRIGEAAKAVAMPDHLFEEKAGGHEAADLLARSFERGNLTPLQLRARLAEGEAGFGRKAPVSEMVFSIAVGDAR